MRISQSWSLKECLHLLSCAEVSDQIGVWMCVRERERYVQSIGENNNTCEQEREESKMNFNGT